MKKLKVFSILIVCLAFTLMTLGLVFVSCDSGGGTTYYTVTFDANGGSGTVPNNPSTVAAGSSITLPDGSGLTKNGFTFDGWNTSADGTGVL
jgi:hypothetical protein